jgi:hypothetical protein
MWCARSVSDASRVEEIRLLLQVITEGTAEKIQVAHNAPVRLGAVLSASQGPLPEPQSLTGDLRELI